MNKSDHSHEDDAGLADVLRWRQTRHAEEQRARAEFPTVAAARAGLLDLFFAPAHAVVAETLDDALAGRCAGEKELVGSVEFVADLVGVIRAHVKLRVDGWTPERIDAAIARHQQETTADRELFVAAAAGWHLQPAP